MSPLARRTLEVAASQVGVRERGGRNCGPEVESYLARVGLGKGFAWCMAFVYTCVDDAAKELGISNPLVKTGGVLRGYREAPAVMRTYKAKPGAVFIMERGKGLGHTGFVVSVDQDKQTLETIEGNSNKGGSREGDSVLRRVRMFDEVQAYLDLDRYPYVG